MPFINITYSGSKLTEEQREGLFKETTRLMNEVMHKKEKLTSVRIDNYEAGDWAIGSKRMSMSSSSAVYMDIKVTQGTNTAEEKSDMIRQSTLMLKKIIGPIAEASYVVIHEVAGDSWGYNGLTQLARAQMG
ncbi:MAG: tautomerase family protein [Rhodomicrobiaceae bacterium]